MYFHGISAGEIGAATLLFSKRLIAHEGDVGSGHIRRLRKRQMLSRHAWMQMHIDRKQYHEDHREVAQVEGGVGRGGSKLRGEGR